MSILFGKKVDKDWNREKVDWNAIDAKVESRIIVVTRPGLNGKLLGHLSMRNTYGVNVSRVLRGDIRLLATDDLRLQYGDRLTVVGDPASIDHVEQFLGNAVKTLNEPNLGSCHRNDTFQHSRYDGSCASRYCGRSYRDGNPHRCPGSTCAFHLLYDAQRRTDAS